MNINMPHSTHRKIITETKNWITNVVIGCNFCPFAAKEMKKGSIHFEVSEASDRKTVLEKVLAMMIQLDTHEEIETSLLILPDGFQSFDAYLDLMKTTEKRLVKNKYEGIYQVAGFHPLYLFTGTDHEDASNYTNRSPYPMLHFLREKSVSHAVDNYPDIENVPNRNIAYANSKGLVYMQQLMGK